MDQYITARAARIVGNPTPGWWAQTLVYEPPFPDARESRGSLYVALDLAGSSAFDAGSCGKEVITALQESYYETTEGGVLEALEHAVKKALDTLTTWVSEHQVTDTVEGNIAAAVRWGTYWYVASSGTARVALFRSLQGEGELATIVMGEKTKIESASGVVAPGDFLIVATNAFCRLVTPKELVGHLATLTPEDVIDVLAPNVHGQEGTARVAAVFVKISTRPVPSLDEEGIVFVNKDMPQVPEDSRPSFLDRLIRRMPRLPSLRKPQAPVVYVGGPKRRKWSLLVALGSILLLTGGIVFVHPQLLPKKNGQVESGEIETARSNLEEARALADLNLTRSRSILAETKKLLQGLIQKDPTNEEVKTLLSEVEREHGVLSKAVTSEPEEYYRFSLIADDVTVTDVSLDGQTLVGVNAETKTVVSVDVAQKSARVLLGGEKGPQGVQFMVFTGNNVYSISREQGIAKITKGSKEDVLKPDASWGEIVDMEGFQGNLYLLDPAKRQIWKYIPIADGFSTVRRYLPSEPAQLAEAVSFAIDGTIWVLLKNGSILSYLNGEKQSFSVKDLEPAFSNPTRIFTSEHDNYLYVLDPSNTRVVVLKKDGTYHAQYKSSKMTQALAVFADEKQERLYLVTREAIFAVPLKV